MIYRVLHSSGIVRHVLRVDASAVTVSPLQQFDAPSMEAVAQQVTARNLLLLSAPGAKQRYLFGQFAAAHPQMAAPFVKLVEPLTALNESGNYEAGKLLLQAVVTDTAEQAQLKARLIACYAHAGYGLPA